MLNETTQADAQREDDGGRSEMSFLAWQLETYRRNHTTKATLLVHLITVPMFHLGLLSLLVAPLSLNAGAVISGFVTMVFVVAVQGFTHKKEPNQPYPFRGPFDVLGRILAEQIVTFPRFVFSGAWFEAWREAA
jgi:hypothetical protein